MSATSIAPHPHAVKHQRFVAATPEGQAELERQVGRNLYRRGRMIDACTTDEMADGWLSCESAGERFGWQRSKEARGADAYGRAMMAHASAVEFVNWNSGSEVW